MDLAVQCSHRLPSRNINLCLLSIQGILVICERNEGTSVAMVKHVSSTSYLPISCLHVPVHLTHNLCFGFGME